MSELNLWQLTQQEIELTNLLEAELSEDDEGRAEREQIVQDTLGADIENKLESYARVRQSMETDLAGLKAMREQTVSSIDSRIEAVEKGIERLTDRVCFYMRETNKKEADAGLFKWKYKQTAFCDVVDVESIPEEYMKTTVPKPVTKPDKSAMLKELKAGKEIAGVRIGYHESASVV